MSKNFYLISITERRSLLLVYFKTGLHGLHFKVEYFYVKVDLEG